MKELKKFLTSKEVLVTLFLLIIYGCLIFAIYFNGYSGVPKKVDEMPVTIVNQDSKSKKLANQLDDSLPFKHIHHSSNLSDTQQKLKDRKTYLIIAIPKNFSKDISKNKSVDLNFYINQSNQSSVTTQMNAVATGVGNSVNQQVILKKGQAILAESQMKVLKQSLATQQKKMTAQVATQKQAIAAAPTAAQPQLEARLKQQTAAGSKKINQTAKAQETKIKQGVAKAYAPVGNSVKTKIHKVNPVRTGLNYSLAPFIVNLAIYIGSMLGTVVLFTAYSKETMKVGRLKAFGMLEIAMVLIAIISSGVTVAIISPSMHLGSDVFTQLWLNHALETFASFNLNSIMLMLFGILGTSVNVFLTMLQVVASGGMIPVVAMNDFYQAIHSVAPMYYSVTADFNIMYGGSGTTTLWMKLSLIIIALIVINMIIVRLKKSKPFATNFKAAE